MNRTRTFTASIAVVAAMAFGPGIAMAQERSMGTNTADPATTGASSGASWTKQENVQVVPVKMKMGTDLYRPVSAIGHGQDFGFPPDINLDIARLRKYFTWN